MRNSLLSASLLITCSCVATTDPGTDTNTNWFESCDVDLDCDEDSTCKCQRCTLACSEDRDCSALGHDAKCAASPSGCTSPARICVAPNASTAAPESKSEVWYAHAAWSVFDQDRHGSAIAVDDSGSIYVTGGQGRAPIDLSVRFQNFWIAGYSSNGEPLWEQIEVINDEAQSNGLSIALSSEGTLTTVATIFDGSDTPALRRHDSSGMPLGEFSVDPGITLLATSPDGELIAAGSRLIELRDGRPFTELWVGGLSGEEVTWERSLRGVEGSISTAWDLAVTGGGTFVAGSEGIAADSNASNPWLGAGPSSGGDFSWDIVPEVGGGNGRSVSVAGAPDDGVVVAGFGEAPFIHRYSSDGVREWERTVDARPTAIASSSNGYAVGYGFDGVHLEAASGRVDFFDWDGQLVWRFEDSSCESVSDLVAHGGDLVALLDCNYSLGLVRLPIEQGDLGSVHTGVAPLRACNDTSECQAGHSCLGGLCAPNCTSWEECPQFWQCFAEQADDGECPFLGSGDDEHPGVCLPQCTTNEDCTSVAPGLRCRGSGCVLELPECEQHCVNLVGGCPEGCSPIYGRRLNAASECTQAEDELLGCYPEGRASTNDAGCVESPDGVIYSEGGIAKQSLIQNFGYSLCSPQDAAFDAPPCGD